MRSGEDVDMVWRLLEAGHRCRYEPASTVRHRPRSTFAAWARQRMTYGRSAATLDRKHPGAVAPLRISGWSAAVWSLVLARRPVAAAAVAAGTTSRLAPQAARPAGAGGSASRRPRSSLCGSAGGRFHHPDVVATRRLSARRLATAIATDDARRRDRSRRLLDWFNGQHPHGPRALRRLRLADDVAYGDRRVDRRDRTARVGALAPTFTNWPGRGAG